MHDNNAFSVSSKNEFYLQVTYCFLINEIDNTYQSYQIQPRFLHINYYVWTHRPNIHGVVASNLHLFGIGISSFCYLLIIINIQYLAAAIPYCRLSTLFPLRVCFRPWPHLSHYSIILFQNGLNNNRIELSDDVHIQFH